MEEEPEKRQVEKAENSEFEPWKPQYLGNAEHETPEMEKRVEWNSKHRNDAEKSRTESE